MNTATVSVRYLPTEGHRCTSCVDALLPDDPGTYVGRHRADMAIYVGRALAGQPVELSWSYWAVLRSDEDGKRIASCGGYLPGQPFRIEHEDADGYPECDRGRRPRHARVVPSQAYADYVEGFTS